jgi:hypothetical protein
VGIEQLAKSRRFASGVGKSIQRLDLPMDGARKFALALSGGRRRVFERGRLAAGSALSCVLSSRARGGVEAGDLIAAVVPDGVEGVGVEHGGHEAVHEPPPSHGAGESAEIADAILCVSYHQHTHHLTAQGPLPSRRREDLVMLKPRLRLRRRSLSQRVWAAGAEGAREHRWQ